ncbi:unnamed protein product [Cochlearia groenlandica]
MNTKLKLLLTILLITLTLTHSRPTRPDSDHTKKHSKGNNNKGNGPSPGGYFAPGTEPGTGFSLPGFSGKDWGNIGGGYGGGYSKESVVRQLLVCKEKNHCYMKKLTCPAKCFKYFSRSGKGYGGGGCIIDCKKKCVAYC